MTDYDVLLIGSGFGCVTLARAGVGGGSLNYANTLYEPLAPFYEDPQWAHITDWRDELAPHYAQAKKMLGVVTNPTVTPADVEMQRLGGQFGRAETYHPAPVGVFFGREGRKEPGTSVRPNNAVVPAHAPAALPWPSAGAR